MKNPTIKLITKNAKVCKNGHVLIKAVTADGKWFDVFIDKPLKLADDINQLVKTSGKEK